MHDKGIDRQIYGNDQTAENILCRGGEMGRINYRNDIVSYKIPAVYFAAAKKAQMIFEWRERTDPAGKFNKRSPNGRGNVQPGEPRSPQDE